MDVFTIYQGKGRDEPCVEGKVVRIQVQLQFPDPQGSQHRFQGACLKRPAPAPAPAFYLFSGLVLFLSCLQGIYPEGDEKEPGPDVKQCPGRNQPDPDDSRQGDHICVPGGIGIEDDRNQQQPEQEKQHQGYEDVPKHTSKVGLSYRASHSKSADPAEL